MRSEAALRKRVQELESRFQQQEEAKLTEQERTTKRLADIEAERATWLLERQTLLLKSIVDAKVRDKNLVAASLVSAILQHEYADQLDYDENGHPTNADYLIDRAIEKYPSLVNVPQPQVPGSGRQVSPPRTPAGQYAQRPQAPQTPVPPGEWPSLGGLSKEQWAAISEKPGQ